MLVASRDCYSTVCEQPNGMHKCLHEKAWRIPSCKVLIRRICAMVMSMANFYHPRINWEVLSLVAVMKVSSYFAAALKTCY